MPQGIHNTQTGGRKVACPVFVSQHSMAQHFPDGRTMPGRQNHARTTAPDGKPPTLPAMPGPSHSLRGRKDRLAVPELLSGFLAQAFHFALDLSFNPGLDPSFNPALDLSFCSALGLSFNPGLGLSFNPALDPSFNPALDLSFSFAMDLERR